GLQMYALGASVPAGMIQIKTCTSGIYTAFVTGDCPSGFTMQFEADKKTPRALGYSWKSAADVPAKWGGATEILMCQNGNDYFASRNATCEG
ncbi:hypothetical protein, partial [Bacillus thuringiensis]|uniref:hypothetical protein n=1 Tax=Bacillus thuringiensis TaxID=1428 RepID=UPI00159B9A32